MKYQLGEVLKRVRQSKRYTQKYIAGDQMSRATYAKIEACDMQPTVGKFMHILKQLDISYEELMFIQNMYHLDGKDEIIHDFFDLSTNVEQSSVLSLINKCGKYLENYSDNVVKDIQYVCKASMLLHSEKTIDPAYSFAQKVWERLSQLDNWYSTELKLINCIFFFFPIETGIEIVKRALHEIDRFSYINKNIDLKSSYLLNITVLLIKNKQFKEASNYAEKAIGECKTVKKYDGLAFAYARKGIIFMNEKRHEEGLRLVNKGLTICTALDQKSMAEAIIQEVHELTSIDIDLTI
ncbi:helix-turn-helix transcriptional regulator [Sporolactobacillus sp. STCC-11]|uniref:helix-turn-helix domain-containing protein n=1 Tax=Sporolactobacillus caesalpiniae TaxID=3230362 RepID=UPI00339B8E46